MIQQPSSGGTCAYKFLNGNSFFVVKGTRKMGDKLPEQQDIFLDATDRRRRFLDFFGTHPK